jgi:hypothetical protein
MISILFAVGVMIGIKPDAHLQSLGKVTLLVPP